MKEANVIHYTQDVKGPARSSLNVAPLIYTTQHSTLTFWLSEVVVEHAICFQLVPDVVGGHILQCDRGGGQTGRMNGHTRYTTR